MMSGPYADVAVPEFQVHVSQQSWIQDYSNNQCTVTPNTATKSVFKDVAVRCKDFDVLLQAPKMVMNDNEPGCDNSARVAKLFFRGTNSEGTSTWDSVNVAPTIGTSVVNFNGGSIYVEQNSCSDGSCSGDQFVVLEFQMFCGTSSETDTEVKVVTQCDNSGGCYSDVSINTPPNSADTTLKDTVMAGGLCGGWHTDVQPTFAGRHSQCRGIPIHPFAGDDSCRNSFVTWEYNSLFRKWELWTLDNPADNKYDAIKWDGAAIQDRINKGIPEPPTNPDRLAEGLSTCIGLRQSFDDRSNDNLNSDVPMDAMILAVQDHCATDTYYAIVWSETKMKDTVCSALHPKFMYEKRDIACANQVITNQANRDAEVAQSQEAVNLMNFCTFDDPDLSGLSCAGHVFRNTRAWSCGVPAPPTNTEWDSNGCAIHNQGSSCLAQCKSGEHTFVSGSGETVCQKVQGEGLKDVDVDMVWSSPTLACQPCHSCASSEDVKEACLPTSNSACMCKAGYSGIASTPTTPTSQCSRCPSGHFTSQPDTVVCSECSGENGPNPGFASSPGATSCSPCYTCDFTKEKINSYCSATADRTCKCDAGYAGTQGNCQGCTAGAGYTDVAGLTECQTCTMCEGSLSTKTACATTSDTVCECKIGYAGIGTQCSACTTGFFSDVNGLTNCKTCSQCNSRTEDVSAVCTTTSDVQCLCKSTSALAGESCHDMLERIRGQ